MTDTSTSPPTDLLDEIVRIAHEKSIDLKDKAGTLLFECSNPPPEEIGWTEYDGGKWDTKEGRPRSEPWQAFGDELIDYSKKVVKKGEGRWIMAATTHNGRCRDDDIESITFMSLDCDGAGEWTTIQETLNEARMGFIVQRSSSHTPEKPKWHLSTPFVRPWSGKKSHWRCIWRWLVGYFAGLAGLTMIFGEERPKYGFDHTTDRLGQPIFISAKRTKDQDPPETIVVKGLALDLDEFLDRSGFDRSWFDHKPVYEPSSNSTLIPADRGLLAIAFGEAGMLGQRIDRVNGYAVECPHEHAHTTGKRFDSSTIIFDPGPDQEKGWFKCLHSCPKMTPEEVLKLLPPECVARARTKWKSEIRRIEEERSTFRRGDHVELATELLKNLGSPIVADIGDIHSYKSSSGLWETIPRNKLSVVVQGFAGQLCSGKPLKVSTTDVSGSIRLASDRIEDSGFFERAPKGIVFRNVFVEVTAEGCKTSFLSPEHRARGGYSFDYESQRSPAKFVKFLDDAFLGDADKIEKIMAVQEFFGACLVGMAPKYARAVVAQGEGSNAKSALGLCLQAAFPQNLISSIPPQAWDSEYERARLAGKRFNFVSELPQADIIESPAVKAIITGDLINARHIRQSPFDYRPTAGHYLCANTLPATNDQTLAFWRRFIVLKFNRCFENDPGKDPNIAEKIISDESPAIVSWGLTGAERLMRQRDYTFPRSHFDALGAWRLKTDQVATFLTEEVSPATDPETKAEPDWTRGSVLYGMYRDWVQANGHKPLSSNNFADRMKMLQLGSDKTKTANLYPVHKPNKDEKLIEISMFKSKGNGGGPVEARAPLYN